MKNIWCNCDYRFERTMWLKILWVLPAFSAYHIWSPLLSQRQHCTWNWFEFLVDRRWLLGFVRIRWPETLSHRWRLHTWSPNSSFTILSLSWTTSVAKEWNSNWWRACFKICFRQLMLKRSVKTFVIQIISFLIVLVPCLSRCSSGCTMWHNAACFWYC